MTKRTIILHKASTTGIVRWLNENFTKLNGKGFSRTDFTWYATTGKLPKYMGNLLIEKDETNKYCTIPVYNIIKEEED